MILHQNWYIMVIKRGAILNENRETKTRDLQKSM